MPSMRVCDQPITDNDFDFSNDVAKAIGTAPSSNCQQHETSWGRGCPPNFFSHPNGTMICILSHKNNRTILEPTTLIEMSEEFTINAQE